MKTIFIGFVCLTILGFADEPKHFPIEVGALKVGARSYEDAKIIGADSIGVKIMHASGTARVPFDHLPDDLRAQFKFDREAARNQSRMEAEAGRVYERQIEASMVAVSLRDTGMERDPELPKKRSEAELMRDSIRAEQLLLYVFRLRSGILRAESQIVKKMLRAQQSHLRTIARSGPYSGRSYRAAGRTIGAHIRTLPEREKIAQARLLIEYAELEISRLER
jgi:hypothetical protein